MSNPKLDIYGNEIKTPRKATGTGFYYVPDIAEFAVNNTTISSRSTLREFEKRHQVRQCGDYTNADYGL